MNLRARFHLSQSAEQQFKNPEYGTAELSLKPEPSSPLSLESKSFESWDFGQPAFQVLRGAEWQLPERGDNHFQLGKDPFDEESVIYMRLNRFDEVLKALLPLYYSGKKIEILIRLQSNGYEFCKHRIPFESITANLDVKYKVRHNPEKLQEFLKNLSLTVQVLAEPENGNSKVVLESEKIFYGSLNHTVASLSVCRVRDVTKNPISVFHVDCHIFLDRVPSWCTLGPREKSGNLCTECSEGSYLMRVFNDVKNSLGTIDLARPKMSAMNSGPTVDTDDLDGGYECTNPTHLSARTTTAKAVATETVESPLSALKPESAKSETEIEKSPNDFKIQASVESEKEILGMYKVLGKVMTTTPIRRKHRRYPLEKFLVQKVERMQQRLLQLRNELAKRQHGGSNDQSESLGEAEVPSSSL